MGKKKRPHFNCNSYYYPKEAVTNLIRESFHTLDDLIKDKGCNLLVSYQGEDRVIRFFNLVIPAKKIIKPPYR